MKRFIGITFLVFSAAAAGYCQDTLKIQSQQSVTTDSLQEIDIPELPEVIKENISGEDYSSWILQKAYRTVGKPGDAVQLPGTLYYVVELKKDDEIIRVWFDEEGNERAE